jgi:transcriptional regulator with XRE-family HTH domain
MNLRKYRLAMGLSQEKLAAGMDVDQGFVSRLEAGDRNPTIVTIDEAATVLRIAPAQLFEEASAPPRRPKARRKKD